MCKYVFHLKGCRVVPIINKAPPNISFYLTTLSDYSHNNNYYNNIILLLDNVIPVCPFSPLSPRSSS